MGTRWSGEQVTALAPDPSSVAAGRRLAVPGHWSATGACTDPPAVWGECRGSGSSPYRTAVDLQGPAFSCSCPSRKFPCKHALGLLLLWSAGSVPDAAAPPDRVAGWLAERAERVRRRVSPERPPGGEPAGVADPGAARRRAEQRRLRMLGGLAELDQWLLDQVRGGLAGTQQAGYAPFDALAARMVDAQLPGVAATVRRLAATAVSGEGWPGRLLAEYGLLHLLARAAPTALADPGSPLAATVRAHLGVSVPKDDVLATPGVRDRWSVLGLRDDLEDRLTVRRVWLRGARTGRMALVMSFAVGGQPLDTTLTPGTALEADLHFYPGTAPLRALVGARHGPAGPADGVPGVGLGAALASWARALTADPWIRAWPVVLAGVVPVVETGVETGAGPGAGPGTRPGAEGERWSLVDAAGALPMVGIGEVAWSLLAVSGGRPVTLLAEIVPGGVRAVAPLTGAAVEAVAR